MILSLALLSLAIAGQQPAKPLHVLFLGNSHTAFNNVPALVKGIGNSAGHPITFEVRTGAFLEDIAAQPEVQRMIRERKFDVVVMQAAKVSSSHQYTYPQDRAIALAKSAKGAGTRVVLFSEWPRQGVDEAEYTLDVYRRIAKAAGGAEIATVAYAWARVLQGSPQLPLWSDGNHASARGSFLAAEVLYRWIAKDDKSAPTFRSDAVTPGEARWFQQIARDVYVEEMKAN
jgi:hypothetical protein